MQNTQKFTTLNIRGVNPLLIGKNIESGFVFDFPPFNAPEPTNGCTTFPLLMVAGGWLLIPNSPTLSTTEHQIGCLRRSLMLFANAPAFHGTLPTMHTLTRTNTTTDGHFLIPDRGSKVGNIPLSPQNNNAHEIDWLFWNCGCNRGTNFTPFRVSRDGGTFSLLQFHDGKAHQVTKTIRRRWLPSVSVSFRCRRRSTEAKIPTFHKRVAH